MGKLLIFFIVIILFGAVTFSKLNLSTYQKDTITVELRGTIDYDGFYELPIYTTIRELLEMIDLNANYDLSSINLMTILKNNDVLYIPTKSKIVKVSINTATIEQLDSLPGIGISTAQQIIDYRNANGLFSQIEDITKVAGIKEAKFTKIKDLIKL